MSILKTSTPFQTLTKPRFSATLISSEPTSKTGLPTVTVRVAKRDVPALFDLKDESASLYGAGVPHSETVLELSRIQRQNFPFSAKTKDTDSWNELTMTAGQFLELMRALSHWPEGQDEKNFPQINVEAAGRLAKLMVTAVLEQLEPFFKRNPLVSPSRFKSELMEGLAQINTPAENNT